MPAFERQDPADTRPRAVLIHALGADARMWDDFSRLVDGTCRPWAPDLYGVGETPRHSRPPTASDHADMLVPLIGQFDAPVVVIGCAVGSMVAAEVAARLGRRAAGLVMANPILRITEPAGDALRARAERARAGGITAIIEEVVGRSFEGIDSARKAAFRDRLRLMDGDAYADLAEGICGCDVAPALARLECPVLLVPGALDQILPDWHAPEITGIVPWAQTVPVAGGAHFMPQQAPGEFARVVAPFLARVAAS